MKVTIASAALAVFVCCTPAISEAVPTLTINPNSDGSIYVCEGCNPVSDGSTVLAAFYIQGIVKFSSEAITAPVSQAFLTLNPYSLPLFGQNLEVYGYGTTLGQLDETDGNAGALLGTLVLPLDLGFGQDAFFDVTAFVNTVNAPFLAFNLRSPDGVDDFSSLEFNYGHPSQLLITFAVPEPPLATLLLAALLAYLGFSLHRLTAHREHRMAS